MKRFLLSTTTNDRWEIVGSFYIVNADSVDSAKNKLEINEVIISCIDISTLDDIYEIHKSIIE